MPDISRRAALIGVVMNSAALATAATLLSTPADAAPAPEPEFDPEMGRLAFIGFLTTASPAMLREYAKRLRAHADLQEMADRIEAYAGTVGRTHADRQRRKMAGSSR